MLGETLKFKTKTAHGLPVTLSCHSTKIRYIGIFSM